MLNKVILSEDDLYKLKLKTALDKNELVQLFLAENGYKFSWSRWDTYNRGVKNNLDLIHSYLVDYKRETNNPYFIPKLRRALLELCYRATSETLYIVAYFIRIEAAFRSHNKVKPDLSELDLAELASCLEQKIQQKKPELMQERYYFGGDRFADGVYGKLTSLSNLSQKKGGPSFV